MGMLRNIIPKKQTAQGVPMAMYESDAEGSVTAFCHGCGEASSSGMAHCSFRVEMCKVMVWTREGKA